jgi:hypothetical protein
MALWPSPLSSNAAAEYLVPQYTDQSSPVPSWHLAQTRKGTAAMTTISKIPTAQTGTE